MPSQVPFGPSVPLSDCIGPKLSPATTQAAVVRSWYTENEVESLFQKCGLTASLWFSAGVLLQLSCRLRALEPELSNRAVHVAELLLVKVWDRHVEFDKEEAASQIENAPKLQDSVGDPEFVLRQAISIGLRLVHMASKTTITSKWEWHTPWGLTARLHSGALYTLYAQQEVYVYDAWYKHARKVVLANERRKDVTPESKEWGRPIPPRLLDATQKVSVNGFGGFDSDSFIQQVRSGENWLLQPA